MYLRDEIKQGIDVWEQPCASTIQAVISETREEFTVSIRVFASCDEFGFCDLAFNQGFDKKASRAGEARSNFKCETSPINFFIHCKPPIAVIAGEGWQWNAYPLHVIRGNAGRNPSYHCLGLAITQR